MPERGPHRETFERVQRSLERWEPAAMANHPSDVRLKNRFEEDLDTVAPTDIERRSGRHTADVVVAGEVGVALVPTVRKGRVEEVRQRLALLGDQHEYLVVYWWDPATASADSRRLIERQQSAYRLGVSAVSYVTRSPVSAVAAEDEGRSVALLLLLASVTVLAAAALGVLALLLPTGPVASLLLVGAGVTLLSGLVLSVLLT